MCIFLSYSYQRSIFVLDGWRACFWSCFLLSCIRLVLVVCALALGSVFSVSSLPGEHDNDTATGCGEVGNRRISIVRMSFLFPAASNPFCVLPASFMYGLVLVALLVRSPLWSNVRKYLVGSIICSSTCQVSNMWSRTVRVRSPCGFCWPSMTLEADVGRKIIVNAVTVWQHKLRQ